MKEADLQWIDNHHRLNLARPGRISELLAMAAADESTAPRHLERMALIALELASQVGISEPAMREEILFTALLHDLGHSEIKAELLRKPGPMTLIERFYIETHVHHGADKVARVPGWEPVGRAVRAHHEWWNGEGYPCALAMEEIPLAARIVAVADVFEALTAERPYHQPLSIPEGIEHIRLKSGAQFDPSIVSAFLAISEEEWRELFAEAESMPLLQPFISAQDAL